ncbi:UPF0280 family protein [Desulfotomaculum copahuensis]|uniref:Thiamine biosynthesis protein ApbE n=1 Tax=Desulfotomaculum copahuensis TaxID=1838280 RepID=A0A1B7LH72_9FIRM|nr:UPF0280 family protein [Desulfotomaculum copahuensis]OAT85458.1 thiamine biosynthesis protein ApbE [Desulfotomaculum copahuensis]
MSFIRRTYRQWHRQEDLIHFQVVCKETDLDIGIRRERYSPELVQWVEKLVRDVRGPLEEYVRRDPAFLKAHTPYQPLPGAPAIAVEMADAGRRAGVGPMAAVAGAVAGQVGKALCRRSRDVIVENGGDIFLRSACLRRIGIFAGQSAFTGRLALEIRPEDTPLGICTSSGTVGHSLSYGCADAVVVLSASPALADAAATAAGNLVQSPDDVQKAAGLAAAIPGIAGVVVICGDKLAAWGRVKLVPAG